MTSPFKDKTSSAWKTLVGIIVVSLVFYAYMSMFYKMDVPVIKMKKGRKKVSGLFSLDQNRFIWDIFYYSCLYNHGGISQEDLQKKKMVEERLLNEMTSQLFLHELYYLGYEIQSKIIKTQKQDVDDDPLQALWADDVDDRSSKPQFTYVNKIVSLTSSKDNKNKLKPHPQHFLRDYCAIIFFENGVFQFEEKKIVVKPGDGLFFSGGEENRFIHHSGAAIYFYFTTEPNYLQPSQKAYFERNK